MPSTGSEPGFSGPRYHNGAHSQQRTTRRSYSAGGVVYQTIPAQAGEGGSVQVALIATNGGRRWQLPKGRLEADEEPLVTAIREVEEETGLIAVYEAFLKTIEYHYVDTYSRYIPELVIKRVDFYLLRVVGGELSDQSFEVDAVAWYTPAEALALLTFPSEQECIQLAQEYWT
jgi:8-oxo-dGTP pyrophosphatase MutT (NUDIX family)